MYARTVPDPEKQPQLREFLDEPDTPLDIRVPPPGPVGHKPPRSWTSSRKYTSSELT